MLLLVSALTFAMGSFAQQRDDVSAASLSSTTPGYADKSPVGVVFSQPAASVNVSSDMILDFPTNSTSSGAVFTAGKGQGPNGPSASSLKSNSGHGSHQGVDGDNLPDVSTIDGLDSLATFSSAYINQAGPDLGNLFKFTMVGNDPRLGHTTVIP
jgi:hypothetical protein